MAYLATPEGRATVHAIGEVKEATMSMNSALMEMLATVYRFILLAAIREGIQNACDISRKCGIPISSGVFVTLPTLSSPEIVIRDKGTGMTKAFMENEYMSFGTSTKAESDSVGGLGVGRWAAYGYIRECFITTCHASDMVSRTYFQFMGKDGKPSAQLASESPGTECGTTISFPVKPTDIAEVSKALGWLKEIMQLTVGDSFTVDGELPVVLPPTAGVVFDLGLVDPTLDGVRIHPMQGSELQYGAGGTLTYGSLLVQVDRDSQVGGLPFHVSNSDLQSAFNSGVIIEVPMKTRLPFMPSREELKYTEALSDLMTRIDKAAKIAVVNHVRDITNNSSLTLKSTLNSLMGKGLVTQWNFISRNNALSNKDTTAFGEALHGALGRSWWSNSFTPAWPYLENQDFQVQVCCSIYSAVKTAFKASGRIGITSVNGKDVDLVTFKFSLLPTLIVFDCPGALTRARAFARSGGPDSDYAYVFFSGDNAEEAAKAFNAQTGNELKVLKASALPALPKLARSATGARVLSSTTPYYGITENKQCSEKINFSDGSSSTKYWIQKDSGKLGGVDIHLAQLMDCGLSRLMKSNKKLKLYLLTKRETTELLKLQAEAAEAAKLLDAGEEASMTDDEVTSILSWKSIYSLIEDTAKSKEMVSLLTGVNYATVDGRQEMLGFVKKVTAAPRTMLNGTYLETRLSKFINLQEASYHLYTPDDKLANNLILFKVLAEKLEKETLGVNLEALCDLMDSYSYVSASFSYTKWLSELGAEFPLLLPSVMFPNAKIDLFMDELFDALARRYK